MSDRGADPHSHEPSRADTGGASSQPPARPPLLESSALFQGHRAVEIHHNGELYRLQATRTGKLILTK
jgi:hemin uptake protein HemP